MARGRGAAECGPFLKWAGGKGALLSAYEPLYPRTFRAYHEPFLGAGAVYFRLAESGLIQGKAHLSDVNPDLVLTFRMIKEETVGVMAVLRKLRAAHSDERYYEIRERFNRRRRGDVERAAQFIYLNKTGFNGLWRVNSRGELNVPVGRNLNASVFSVGVLRAAAGHLRKATVEARDFETVLGRASADDFVYFDPPYEPLTRTAYFTGYARGGFGRAQQERLAEVFRELDRKGVQVMLSNHDTPLMRLLYKGTDLHKLQTSRPINSKAARRKTPVAELVVRNYRNPGE